MPEMPAQGGGWSQQYGSVAASSIGTTITSGASSSTKGTLVELIASTEQDGHWLSVTIVQGATGTNTVGLLDILIGAATEQVLIANLPTSTRGGDEGGGGPFLFPLFIPKGSRLSGQYQANNTSCTVEVILHQFGGTAFGPYAGCTYVDRYGDTASSRGTNVDPGAVANTYSSVVELTSSTLRPIRWLVIGLQNVDTAMSALRWTIELLIGAATEVVVGGDLMDGAGATTDNLIPVDHYYIPIFIPQATRLAVKAKCSSTTDGDRDLYVSLFGCG